jgi:hypothetical protein
MKSIIFFKSNNVQLAPHNQKGYFQKNINSHIKNASNTGAYLLQVATT